MPTHAELLIDGTFSPHPHLIMKALEETQERTGNWPHLFERSGWWEIGKQAGASLT
jgi:hypothetical protein